MRYPFFKTILLLKFQKYPAFLLNFCAQNNFSPPPCNGANYTPPELPLAIGIVLDRLDNRLFDNCTDIDILLVHELDKKLTTRAMFLERYEYGPTIEFIDNLMEFSCEVVNPAMDVKPKLDVKMRILYLNF